jgi:hypothetical protein
MPLELNETKGAANTAASTREDRRPTHDQLYLASRLSPEDAGKLSPAAIQKLNNRYGPAAVTQALRLLRGFPPETEIRSLYAYLESVCKQQI